MPIIPSLLAAFLASAVSVAPAPPAKKGSPEAEAPASKLRGVQLATPEDEIERAIKADALSTFMKSIEAAVARRFAAMPAQAGQELLVQCELPARGAPEIALASRPGLDDAALKPLHADLVRLPGPKRTGGPVRFQMLFALWGGALEASAASPPARAPSSAEGAPPPASGPPDPAAAEKAKRRLKAAGVDFAPGRFLGAAMRGDVAAIDLFLAAGMSPDAKDESGDVALREAAVRGHLEVVQRLLGAGADPNLKGRDGHTALQEAIVQRETACVVALLEAGANPNLFYRHIGDTPLLRASSLGQGEIVLALLKAGADPNRASEGGLTVLLSEAQKGDAPTLAALIAAGADVNAKAPGGATPLLMAVLGGKAEAVRLLLKAGANAFHDRETLLASATTPEIKKLLTAAPPPRKK